MDILSFRCNVGCSQIRSLRYHIELDAQHPSFCDQEPNKKRRGVMDIKVWVNGKGCGYQQQSSPLPAVYELLFTKSDNKWVD